MFSNPDSNVNQFGLVPGMTVADLGAGTGFYTMASATHVGGAGHVYAIDVQKDLLEKLKKTATQYGFKNVEIIWGDLEQAGGTRLKDASVDAVIVANLLFQLRPEAKPVLALEVARILKPGGRLLVIDWTDSFGGIGPSADAVFGPDEVRALFASSGTSSVSSSSAGSAGPVGTLLDEERTINAGDHHYGIVFRKAKN